MGIDDLMRFVLVLVRVAGVFAFLPFLGEGAVPKAVKALASLVVAAAIAPLSSVQLALTSWQPIQFFLFAAAEGLFGALMGMGALLIFKSLRNAGEMVGQQMGMALAQVADPISGVQATLIGNFCDVVGTLTFFAVGGHLWMLSALHESFASWPLGAFLAPDFIRRVSLAAVVSNLDLAFRLAAPLLLLCFMVSVLMALTARLVPEINVLIVGFPLRIGVGLVGVALFVPVLVRYSAGVTRAMTDFMSGVAAGS